MRDVAFPVDKTNDRAFYRIRVRGHLDEPRSAWFDGLAVVPSGDDETVLAGALPDQAALHGVLAKIRDLGLPLLSLNRVEPESSEVKRQTSKRQASNVIRQTSSVKRHPSNVIRQTSSVKRQASEVTNDE